MRKPLLAFATLLLGSSAVVAQDYTFSLGAAQRNGALRFTLVRSGICSESFEVSIDRKDSGSVKAQKVRNAVNGANTPCGSWRALGVDETLVFEYWSETFHVWRKVRIINQWQDASGGRLQVLAPDLAVFYLDFPAGAIASGLNPVGKRSSVLTSVNADGCQLPISAGETTERLAEDLASCLESHGIDAWVWPESAVLESGTWDPDSTIVFGMDDVGLLDDMTFTIVPRVSGSGLIDR